MKEITNMAAIRRGERHDGYVFYNTVRNLNGDPDSQRYKRSLQIGYRFPTIGLNYAHEEA